MKDKLVFDTTVALDESDNTGAFVRSAAGVLITHTTVAGKEALDVNLVGGPDSGIFAEDSAHTSGENGQFILAVRNDADTSLVDTDGDYAPLQVDENGRLKVVADLEVAISMEKAEDSAHVSGDIGAFNLGVRQDTLANSVSADNDYAAFKMTSRGALWTTPVGTVADDAVDTENPNKIGTRTITGALTAVSAAGDRADAVSDLWRRIYINDSPNVGAAFTAVDVDNTVGGVSLTPTPLPSRRRLMIQNLGNQQIFIGVSGVTVATGTRLAAGATMTLEIGPDVSLFGIAAGAATQNIRIFELG